MPNVSDALYVTAKLCHNVCEQPLRYLRKYDFKHPNKDLNDVI